MNTSKPPKYVRQVLTVLQSRGHPAWLVGGCVRDMLLGIRPHDWDICTGALPQQVLEIFPGSRPTGLQHGTVTVVIGSRSVEVTTFRSEGGYADHRHPDMVSFVGDLTQDLSRRDFTMNAIALSADGILADPFGGVEDIRQKRIRCVGYPEQRFEEDALRMFRALRFGARLGFTLEEETRAAIVRKAPLAACLAVERVRDEVEKILLTKAPETMFSLMALGLLDPWLTARPGVEMPFLHLSALPRKALERWAGFCVELERQGCIPSVGAFLRTLRLDNRSIQICTDASRLLQEAIPKTPLAWKRILRRWGVETVCCAARAFSSSALTCSWAASFSGLFSCMYCFTNALASSLRKFA